jgi:hypothetical protein
MMALLRIVPDRPESGNLLKWLISRKTGDHWISTKTTGIVLSALSSYLMARKEEIPKEPVPVDVSLNGEVITSRRIALFDAVKEGGWTLALPATKLRQGDNRVHITTRGEVFYSMGVKTLLRKESIEPASRHCDIRVLKNLYAVTRVQDLRGRPRILSRPLEPGEPLKVGDEIRVQVRFVPDRTYRYFILEDGLPAGFECVDFDKGTGSDWRTDYTHKEHRDQKTVFFFDRLMKGREVTVDYILRSEAGGEVFLPPARLYGMYRPLVQSHSQSGRMVVGQ